MTPEERAEQAIQQAGLDWGGRYELDAPRLETAIAAAIRAAVDEAVAGEREACAVRLDRAAEFFRNMARGEKDPNILTAQALENEAAGIRARGEGEG